MIKIITFLITFFKSNKSKIFLIIVFVVAVVGAFIFGLHEGKTQAEIKYANLKVKQSADAGDDDWSDNKSAKNKLDDKILNANNELCYNNWLESSIKKARHKPGKSK